MIKFAVHGLAPGPAHLRTFPHISSMDCARGRDNSVHLKDFPVAACPSDAQMSATLQRDSGGRKVLSYRATTGFGGLFAVTTILLAIQAITGVGAFPL